MHKSTDSIAAGVCGVVRAFGDDTHTVKRVGRNGRHTTGDTQLRDGQIVMGFHGQNICEIEMEIIFSLCNPFHGADGVQAVAAKRFAGDAHSTDILIQVRR